MSKPRIIARLDIKGANLIKGIHLEGLRVIGNPNEYATQYYEEGIDEILYMDIVASLYNRNNLEDVIVKASENIFIPLTVGGGIRSVADARKILSSGADKIALNTAAIKKKELISDMANAFGAQCVVLSIEAKNISPGKWLAFYDNGREQTEIDVVEWAQKSVDLGAGEILLTSIDREGTKKGFDQDLLRAVTDNVNVPVIISGGYGKVSDITQAVNHNGASAVAIADSFHYKRTNVTDLKNSLLSSGTKVRKP